jgi:serine/threonine-protein kinase
MGEVYRARDTKLNRDVALKILPELFALDPDRLARFKREAQVLASLNHPSIAAIYGFEESNGVQALVLELVEGPTLADRIAHGPIPLDEALPIARQIAEALEAAHAQGIIHRDLKPANVKVRADGTVKVLDFGLAKALDPHPGASDAFLSPTKTSPAMTRMGIIMGTAAYMSPEQARGSVVDARSDIWSFGVVLYEMLTGKTLFEGPTVSDTLASVLRADPEWARLPSGLPQPIRTLLGRCLQRDSKRRLQHIGDARIEIEELQSNRGVSAPETKTPRRVGLAVAAALLSAAVVGTLAWSLKPTSPSSPLPTRVVINTASGAPLVPSSPLALSPDGRQLAYVVGFRATRLLYHQSLDVFDPRLLKSIGNVHGPFFSPVGDAVGFSSNSVMQQIRLAGGAATRLFDAADLYGASWGEGATIVFSPEWGQPLRIARLATSETTDLTRLDVAAGEGAHLWPQILPGNKAVLFTIWTGTPTWDEAQLAVANLDTGQHTVVLRGGTTGRYAASGHLVFWRGNALMAAPFDLDALAVTGEPVRVVPDVRLENGTGGAHFALSQTGTLAYVKGGVDTFAESFIAERSGLRVVRLDEMVSTGTPAFSPEGKRVALTLYKGGAFGIGVYDLERGLLTPLPLGGDNFGPIWTKDGHRVTFLSNAGGGYNYYSIPFDGSGKPDPVFSANQGPAGSRPAWSPDGRHLVYVKSGRENELGHLDSLARTGGHSEASHRDTRQRKLPGVLAGWSLHRVSIQ